MEPARDVPPGIRRINLWNEVSREEDTAIPLYHNLPVSLRPYVLERPNHIGRMNLTGYLLGNGVVPDTVMHVMSSNNAGNERANDHVRSLLRDYWSRGAWSQGHRYLDQTLGHSLHPLRSTYPSYAARIAAGRRMGMGAVGLQGGRGEYSVRIPGAHHLNPKLGRGSYCGRGAYEVIQRAKSGEEQLAAIKAKARWFK
jgi:hypothetical protein